jgi:hypothetical protein
MSGYWNRDMEGEPFTAYCSEHLPVPLVPAWRAVTCRQSDAPSTLDAFLARGHGDTPEQRERWSQGMTPDGYAYTPWTVGAPCAVCGVSC